MGDKSLPDGERLAQVLLGDGDLPQATTQLRRRICVIVEAGRPRWKRRVAVENVAALPASRALVTNRCIGIFAERGCQCALVAWLCLKVRDCGTTALFKRPLKRIVFRGCCRQ